jgi:hypothetical protein
MQRFFDLHMICAERILFNRAWSGGFAQVALTVRIAKNYSFASPP